MSLETCICCPARSPRFGMVAIIRAEQVWVSGPVCDDCWRDPAHRERPIKAHFFPRHQEALALKQAGAASIG